MQEEEYHRHTVDIGARGQRGIVGECLGNIIVSTVHILIFLWRVSIARHITRRLAYARENAVQPVQNLLFNSGHSA